MKNSYGSNVSLFYHAITFFSVLIGLFTTVERGFNQAFPRNFSIALKIATINKVCRNFNHNVLFHNTTPNCKSIKDAYTESISELARCFKRGWN